MNEDPYEFKFKSPVTDETHWLNVIIGIICIGIILSSLWIMRATASDHNLETSDVMFECLLQSMEAAASVSFETEAPYKAAVEMLVGGCMYYQLLEYSTCEQTPVAYPSEPDGEEGEFTHTF